MKTVLIKGIRFYQKYLSPLKEGALPLYADLLAVRAGSDSEIWCFQRKSAGIMENTSNT